MPRCRAPQSARHISSKTDKKLAAVASAHCGQLTGKRLIDRTCATGLDRGLGSRNSAALPVADSRTAEVASQTDERYRLEATLWIQELGNSPSGNKCEGSGSAAEGYRGKYRRWSLSAKDTTAAGWP